MERITQWKARGTSIVRQLVAPKRHNPRPVPPPVPGLAQTAIPFDVLASIFDIYVYFLKSEHKDISNKAIPWVLGQICHSWRQAALSSPQYWYSFTLEVTEENANNELPEMYQELLQRSGSKPLRLSIDFFRYFEQIPLHPFQILEPINNRCSQWGHLMLHGLDIIEIYRQFGSAQGKLHSLCSMNIHLRSKIPRDDDLTLAEKRRKDFSLFSVAPSLSEVVLNDMSGHLKVYEPALPWDQLTSYVTYGLPEAIFPTELERQSNLQSLTCMHNNFPSIPTKEISHQHLRHLCIYATTGIEACFTQMANVTLPALENLAVIFLTMELRYDVSAIPAITTLVTRSKCKLKSLVIQQNCSLAVKTLPALFSQIPSLETLDIGHGSYFLPTLKALCYDPTQPTLLPNLLRLVVVYNTSSQPSDIKTLSDLVYSRQQVSTGVTSDLLAPLTYVRVFIKRSETRYFAFLDLIDEYIPPPQEPGSDIYPLRYSGNPKPDSYPIRLLGVPEFDTKLNQAVSELQQALSSGTQPSTEATAKWREISVMYYERILSSTSPNLNPKEKEAIENLRELCRTRFPPAFFNERRWLIADPLSVLFIHQNHPIRYCSRNSDIIMGMKNPTDDDLEGYGYWLGEYSNNLLENLRTFVS